MYTPSLTQCLYELHSYNSMLAVVGGLNHFSIRRLAQTWSRVDKGKKEVDNDVIRSDVMMMSLEMMS